MRHTLIAALVTLAILAVPAAGRAQQLIPGHIACRVSSNQITYPVMPLPYPQPSTTYSLQYRIGFGAWTDVPVNSSIYGATNASPNHAESGYTDATSMSFASIPAHSWALVQVRVTKITGRFLSQDHVSVRPSVKLVDVDLDGNGAAVLTTFIGPDFKGEQFLLFWGDATVGGAVEGLVLFIDPPYSPPTGNVKTIQGTIDPNADLTGYDAIDFEGQVVVGPTGDLALNVPKYINTVYFGPGAWVQGKLRFKQSGAGVRRTIYGPGVLDGSRFEYDLRACDENSPYPDQGYHAISIESRDVPDTFAIDGVIITDHNHATADLLVNGVVNNVKSIGWNGLNGGFRLGDGTTATNVFLRSGDDSLMMWGVNVTVTNATVWQNYNGGVVNLGWGDKTKGDGSVIDGLYVVKTDWLLPTAKAADWSPTSLNAQNDAVFASVMVPGTMFGTVSPPVFRNTFVEDAPRTLFSLRIVEPQCNDVNAPRAGECDESGSLTDLSVIKLNIENLFTPKSIVDNSAGFETLPAGSTMPGFTLEGTIVLGLVNVWEQSEHGAHLLSPFDPTAVGTISTHGNNVRISFLPIR